MKVKKNIYEMLVNSTCTIYNLCNHKITEQYLFTFIQQIIHFFNTFTAEEFSKTRTFMHLRKHIFHS